MTKTPLLPLLHRRVISLAAMNEFHGQHLANVAAQIEYFNYIATPNAQKGPWETERGKIMGNLSRGAEDCAKLGLGVTQQAFLNCASELMRLDQQTALQRVQSLRTVFQSEMQSHKFYLLPAEWETYWNQPALAGEDFKTKCPKGNWELMEAGNCMAWRRYTACVCHLMRGMDIAFPAIERALGLPRPKNPRDLTWGSRLASFRKQIEAHDLNPPPKWNGNFFRQLCVYLDGMRSAYRDKTFHVSEVYGEEEAKSLFDTSKGFFRHFAKHLRE